MVKSHTVLVWTHYPTKKSLVVVSGEWQTKFNVSLGPGLWSLDLGPFAPDLGPDLDLTWDLDLDLILTIYLYIPGLLQMVCHISKCLPVFLSPFIVSMQWKCLGKTFNIN